MKPREAKSWAKASAYTGLAFILPAAMLICYYAGDWADRKLGTHFLSLVGIMLGFAAGLWETMRQADQIENGIRTGKKSNNNNGGAGSGPKS